MVWDFEDNRGDISIVEEVQALAQERIAVISVFVVEGLLKTLRSDSVGGEQIGSESDEGANTRLAMDFTRIAFYQKLALVPADSLASGSTDLKLLNMDMLVPVHMSRFVEPELEDNVFASVTSQVQAEGIQTLNVKGIRGREDNIRIDGHRHHRCVGSALKQIEITHIQAWILFRKFGIEMMGHRFPLCQSLRSAAKKGGTEGSARQSAVNHQLDRIDIRRIVRGKEKHRLGQIFRFAPTAKWNRGGEEVGKFCGFLLSSIGARPALPDGSLCRSRGHHVHANLARCKVGGDGPRH